MRFVYASLAIITLAFVASGQEEFGRGFKLPPKEVLDARHAEAAQKQGKRMAGLPKVTAPSWDCRTLGIVPPIGNQGNCGSCYIWSAADTAACALIRAGKVKANWQMSKQFGLDCKNLGGCGGGWPAEVLDHIKKNGFPADDEYGPYTARVGSCKYTNQKLHKIDDSGYCTPNQESGIASVQDMKNAIVKFGPISVALDSSVLGDGKGIRSGNGNRIDHAVMIIGWDDSKGRAGCWLMRNSWGSSTWGNEGYCWIEYGAGSIGTEAQWVDVTGSPIPPGPSPDPVPPTPVPDMIVINGGNPVVVEIEKMIVVKEKVTLLSSFPFTLTAGSDGLGYVWEVPAGVKYKRKNNVLEILDAPKGGSEISVEYSKVEVVNGQLKITPKYQSTTFTVADPKKVEKILEKKPQTRNAPLEYRTAFTFVGFRVMTLQPQEETPQCCGSVK